MTSPIRDAGVLSTPASAQLAERAVHAFMHSQVLVAGVGNVLFGDDGFGVEVARRLGMERLPPGTRVANVGLRPLQLAYELLAPADLLLLVHAVQYGRAPGTLYLFEPATPGISVGGAHPPIQGFDLGSALALASYWGASLPLVRVLGCEPCALRGMCLSQPVWQAIEPAIGAILQLVKPRH
jgi:hydrogenase maturation protease